MNVDKKRVKLVTLQLKQIDDSGNIVYSNATPIPVNENDTFKDIEKRILENRETTFFTLVYSDKNVKIYRVSQF